MDAILLKHNLVRVAMPLIYVPSFPRRDLGAVHFKNPFYKEGCVDEERVCDPPDKCHAERSRSMRLVRTPFDYAQRDCAASHLSAELIDMHKVTIYIGRVFLDRSLSEHMERNMNNILNTIFLITIIRYALPVSGDVSLIIYNLLGEEVARLVDGFQPAGGYQTEWNASNASSGIYFYRLTTVDFTETKKMVLLK